MKDMDAKICADFETNFCAENKQIEQLKNLKKQNEKIIGK